MKKFVKVAVKNRESFRRCGIEFVQDWKEVDLTKEQVEIIEKDEMLLIVDTIEKPVVIKAEKKQKIDELDNLSKKEVEVLAKETGINTNTPETEEILAKLRNA